MVNKRDGETDFEYGIRILEAKMEGDLTLDWEEICTLLDYDVHPDTLRKSTQGVFGGYEVSKYYKNNYIENPPNAKELITELDRKQHEIEMSRKKRQAISLEYNKMLREQAREDLIVERLRDLIPTMKSPEFKPIQTKKNGDMKYLLAFGDIHFDKFYESINNNYSTEEIHRRFEVLLEKLIIEIEEKGITHLDIINLGDSLEGLLRVSAIRTLRHGFLESVVLFSRFMSEWLNKLSEYVNITYRHVEQANHGDVRLFNQRQGDTDENIEKVIVNYIHDSLQHNTRINVVIENRDYIDFKIHDFEIYVAHGDSLRNKDRSLADISMLHGKIYDYLFMGHFHSAEIKTKYESDMNDREIYVIPSIVGSDTYSDSLKVGSKSSAMLFGFHKDEGIITQNKFILNSKRRK